MKIFLLCILFLAFYGQLGAGLRLLANKWKVSRYALKWLRVSFFIATRRFVPSLRVVVNYLSEKVTDGLALGVIFAIFGWLDRGSDFVSAVEELFINMHPALVILGATAAYAYIAIKWHYPRDSGYRKFIFRVARAWFDLVQQFFTLALGAFFPVKAFIVGHELFEKYKQHSNTFDLIADNFWSSFAESKAHFLTLAFCAIVLGGLWSLKDQPYPRGTAPQYTKWVIIGFVAIACGLLAVFLTEPKGGIALLQAAGQEMMEFLERFS